MVQTPAFSWALPWVLPSRFQCWLLACGGCGLSLVVLPPLLRCGGCYPGSLSGTCWLAIVELLFLWPPGFCGVPSLHVRSPVSGTVYVLPQSTIVTLLSLLWLGLLLVFVRFHCLRLTLWASACVGPHGCPTFSRVGADPSTWVRLLWPGCEGTLPPCSFSLSSFGMWSPFGVISVFCHYWSPTKVSFGGFFLLGGSLPFRSGVVVSLHPLSVCHGSLWLVTALFPSLSLSLPVPIFSWLRLLLRQVPWV